MASSPSTSSASSNHRRRHHSQQSGGGGGGTAAGTGAAAGAGTNAASGPRRPRGGGGAGDAAVAGPRRSRWRQTSRHGGGIIAGGRHGRRRGPPISALACAAVAVLAAVVFLGAVYVARPHLLLPSSSSSFFSFGKRRHQQHPRHKQHQHNHGDGDQSRSHQHQHDDQRQQREDTQMELLPPEAAAGKLRGGGIIRQHPDGARIEPAAEKGRKKMSFRGVEEKGGSVVSENGGDRGDSYDAVVVGSGLAGMAAALRVLDRGGRVALVEKEPTLGGNSNKASSGINACCLPEDRGDGGEDGGNGDTLDLFKEDTTKSAGASARDDLIDALVSRSAVAVTWLKDRGGVDLSQLVQLGGHRRRRTHRPVEGFVGAEIISALQAALESYERRRPDRFRLLASTRATRLLRDGGDDANGRVVGIECQSLLAGGGGDGHDDDAKLLQLRSDRVVLATGGFASDRSAGSYLSKYRPELLKMPATAGPFSTGDGIALATALGAGLRDMEKIQIHPTGWVDPSDRDNPNKVLAAELLRGVGGVLINRNGDRFCNELGTRKYIADKMMSEDPHYAETRRWDPKATVPTFYLVLSDAAAREGDKHVSLYTHKGLMKKIEGGIRAFAEFTGIPEDKLASTLTSYRDSSGRGQDEFGKVVFRNVFQEDFSTGTFFVGEVTPVLHYCMGGISIDTEGNVLDEEGAMIEGLYAAGEVTGGVHGDNRLGGNSLLECAVFGTTVGERIPIENPSDADPIPPGDGVKKLVDLPNVSVADLARHNTQDDVWVALHGIVYDLTSFVPVHPGSRQPILNLAGKDATAIFDAVHSTSILNRMQDNVVGLWKNDNAGKPPDGGGGEAAPIANGERPQVSLDELKKHNTAEDCWVAIHGTVYDLSEFSSFHPGGEHLITKFAGRDATDSFQGFHPVEKLYMVQRSAIGPLAAVQ